MPIYEERWICTVCAKAYASLSDANICENAHLHINNLQVHAVSVKKIREHGVDYIVCIKNTKTGTIYEMLLHDGDSAQED